MSATIEEVRALSSAICGSRYRLEILCTIANRRTFTATELLKALWEQDTPPAQSIISVEIKRLRDSGLVYRKDMSSTGRSIPLVAAESPVWDAVKTLVGDA